MVNSKEKTRLAKNSKKAYYLRIKELLVVVFSNWNLEDMKENRMDR